MTAGAAPRAPPRHGTAGLLCLAYLFAGLVWIAFSDEVGQVLFHSAEAVTRFQTYKGAAFIAATALFLYVVLARRPPVEEGLPAATRVGLAPLLTVLVLATALPLVALLGYNVLRETRALAEAANDRIRATAAAGAADAQSFFQEQQRIAQLVVRAAGAGRGACAEALRQVEPLSEHLRGVALLDASGQAWCASHPDLFLPLGAAALATRSTLVTPPRPLPVGSVFTVTFATRSALEGSIAGVQLALAARGLQVLLPSPPPEDGVTGLLTADGHVLARAPVLEGVVGRKVPGGSGFDLARTRGLDAWAAQGADGIDRFYTGVDVGTTGVVAIAGVSRERIYGPVRGGALASLAAAAAVLLAAGALVAWVLRRITAPIGALADTAERVAAGQFDRRAPEAGPREIAAVAVQFNRMLDQLPVLQRELREREERHRALLDKLAHNIPGMVFQICRTPERRMFAPFASDAIGALFEVDPQEARQDLAVLAPRVHPDDRTRVREAVRASYRTLAPLTLEYRVLLPTQGVRHHLCQAQAERLEDGSVRWHGCTVDATALKMAQLELARANETLEGRVEARTRELAAANEALESFSYSVAHDLRAPLQVVEGFAQALREALARGDAAKAERYAQRIASNTVTMARMIDGLLAVSRAGKGALRESRVALSRLVGDVLAEVQPPPRLQVEVAPLPDVMADPASLRQVWWNLLANAVKFTARREQGRVEVGWRIEGGEMVFWVRDNGAGFDPQFAGRLFGAFQRLHDAAEFEGTGVGLALARRVVERHGGRMWAEGRPDAGACFFFSLPKSRLA